MLQFVSQLLGLKLLTVFEFKVSAGSGGCFIGVLLNIFNVVEFVVQVFALMWLLNLLVGWQSYLFDGKSGWLLNGFFGVKIDCPHLLGVFLDNFFYVS